MEMNTRIPQVEHRYYREVTDFAYQRTKSKVAAGVTYQRRNYYPKLFLADGSRNK